MRFAVGIWAYGKTGDRFLLGGYRDDAPLPERLTKVSRNKDVSAIELNCPGDVNADNAADIGTMLRSAGLAAAMVGADLSGDRRWRFGSLSSKSPEIREEAGLSGEDIKLIKRGKPLIVEDDKLGVKWIVYPYLFHIEDRDRIKIDWEHKEIRWILAKDIGSYETVPELEKALFRVY